MSGAESSAASWTERSGQRLGIDLSSFANPPPRHPDARAPSWCLFAILFAPTFLFATTLLEHLASPALSR